MLYPRRMGHFRCTCGHQISDSMTPVPWTGHLLRDQDFETIDRLMADIDSYFEAVRIEEREGLVTSPPRGPYGALDGSPGHQRVALQPHDQQMPDRARL
jgi:hypothetical protein